jgi:hypothetical protein
MWEESLLYRHIDSNDANTTVTVATANHVLLGKVIINTTSAQALTITDLKGNKVAVIKASVLEQAFEYEMPVPGGIKVVVPAGYNGDATIGYSL